jgi:hypothetical protein
LQPIFHHNAMDILTLACLTGIVPFAHRASSDGVLAHGADMIGVARWLRKEERYEEALRLLRRAVDRGLRDGLLFRTLWDIAALEKKLGRREASLVVLSDLAASPNPFRVAALAELAKHYEHRERNCAIALEFVRTALEASDSEPLRRREARLRARLAREVK